MRLMHSIPAAEQGRISMLEKKTYYGVDLFKFISALILVVLHTTFLSDINPTASQVLRDGLSRWAVQFFVLASSFFFFQKIDLKDAFSKKNVELYKKYVTKLIVLYLIWSAIYSVIYFPRIIHLQGIGPAIIWLVKSLLVSGVVEVFWFFPALLLSITLVFVLLKFMGVKAVVITSALFFFIGLCLSTYSTILGSVPVLGGIINWILGIIGTPRNGLFFTFLFAALGLAFSKIEIRGKAGTYGLLALAFLLLAILEVFLLNKNKLYPSNDHDINIADSIAGVLCFLFALKLELKVKPVYRILRSMSIIVYVVHPLVWIGLIYISQVTAFTILSEYSLIRTPFVLLGAISLAFIISFISTHRKFAWLKLLY